MGVYAFLRKLYNECTLKLGIAQDFKVSFLSFKHTQKKTTTAVQGFFTSQRELRAQLHLPLPSDFHIKRSNEPKRVPGP